MTQEFYTFTVYLIEDENGDVKRVCRLVKDISQNHTRASIAFPTPDFACSGCSKKTIREAAASWRQIFFGTAQNF